MEDNTDLYARQEINPGKTLSLRELEQVFIEDLKKAVLDLPETEWDREEDFAANYNKDKRALSQTRHIVLKFADKRDELIRYFETSRWPHWKNRVEPLMQQAVKPYGYRKGFFPRVMLAKVPPGKVIPPHIDGQKSRIIPHKIHIPLQTNDQAFFYIDNVRYHLKEGFAYEVNNAVKHAVINNGKSDRIHLVFEYLDRDLQEFVEA